VVGGVHDEILKRALIADFSYMLLRRAKDLKIATMIRQHDGHRQRMVVGFGRGCNYPSLRRACASKATTTGAKRRIASSSPRAFSAHQNETNHQQTHLQRLHLKDFALVSQQTIHFSPGLNVITGKSGSGKSVLLSAIDQITGAAGREDSIRVPAKTAKIAATFYCAEDTIQKLRRCLLENGMDDIESLLNREGAQTVDLYRELQSTANNRLRSLCKIQNKAIPVKVLRQIGNILVDFNGQNASLALANEKAQLNELDSWANVKEYGDAFEIAMQNVRLATKLVQSNVELTEEEKEEIEAILDAFYKIDPVPGEDVKLKLELRQMESRRANWETCASALNSLSNHESGSKASLKEALYESRSVLSQAERRADQLTADSENDGMEISDFEEDENSEDIEALREAIDLLHEVENATDRAEAMLQRYMESLNSRPERREEIQDRLRDLDKLGKMMGKGIRTATSMCEIADELRDKLDAAATSEDEKEGNEEKLRSARAKAASLALDLAVARRDAGSSLRTNVTAAMESLEMQGSRFDVTLSWTPSSSSSQGEHDDDDDEDSKDNFSHIESTDSGDEIIDLGKTPILKASELQVPGCGEIGEDETAAYLVRPRGLDRATFLLAPGASEPLRPMSSIASGGEKARLMLAMKMAPAMDNAERDIRNTESPTISVFDEVDTGVGGRVGTKIGAALKKLAVDGSQQVLCVTHLPQVAAFGETHVRVRKEEDDKDGRQTIAFDAIETEIRLEEIADMLGIGSEQGLENAKRLLQDATN